MFRLGQARLSSWNIAPLLDDWLLNLPGVGARSRADLLGDVDTLFSWLEQGNQLSDVLALLLGLQVASLFWDFRDNSLSLGEALLWAGLQLAAGWATELLGHLLTLGLGRVLLDILLLRLTDLLRPLGTLLFSSVTLGDILALLLLNGLTLNNVILNIVLMIPGGALGLVDGPALNRSLPITDQWGVTEVDLLLRSNLPVLDEAILNEVLLTLLLLLGLKVSGVGGVTLLAVAMLASHNIVILCLLNHDNLVNTPLAGSSD